MEWQDEGIILHRQALGERKQIVSLFTASHGRCLGVLSTTKNTKSWVQCGGKVKARWGARLENHIGYWTLESLYTQTSALLDAPGPLAALLSAATLCHLVLPERQAYARLYERFEALLQDLLSPYWARSYVFFELILLEELGYGLDLKACAVTGTTTNLVAISPRTGRAVCGEIANLYKDRLLSLPPFICQDNPESIPREQEIRKGLDLSGYFLERHLLGGPLPAIRKRFLQKFKEVCDR